MKKYTNPFQEFEDAIAVLESLGANPLCRNQFGTNWTSGILSLAIEREYDEDHEAYFVSRIHITLDGFKDLLRTVMDTLEDVSIDDLVHRSRMSTSNGYAWLEIRLGATLKVQTSISEDEEFIL